MKNVLCIVRRHFNLAVLLGIAAASLLLGILNNLRVDEERRVNWFGGPVVSSDDGSDEEDAP